jgi:hypothetical protein
MEEIIVRLSEKIKDLRRLAEEIMEIGADIETVKRNTKKILANVRMLELNISDLAELQE